MFFTDNLGGQNLEEFSLICILSLHISQTFSEIPKSTRLVLLMLSLTLFFKAYSSEIYMVTG